MTNATGTTADAPNVIEIRSIYNELLWKGAAATLREAVERAAANRARLDGARLDGARLDGASLDGARLDGASLDGARLDPIRDDLYAVLKVARNEAAGLLTALRDGRVDGQVYTGECACLVGTIANLRHEDHARLSIDLRPNASRAAEVWFLAIRKGDTPATSPVAAITAGWVESWLRTEGIDVPVHVPLVWRGDAGRFAREMEAAGVDVEALLRGRPVAPIAVSASPKRVAKKSKTPAKARGRRP